MLKKTLATAITALLLTGTPAANAALPGFYTGLQLGAGTIQYSGNSKTSFAGRAYLGYLFNSYVGAEVAYSGFAQTDPTFKNVDSTIQRNAGDLLIKGVLPLPSNFNLFAKAGVAYVSDVGSKEPNSWMPAYGVGAGYDLDQSVSLDLSFLRYQKVNNSLSSSNLYTLGVSYSFG